MAARSSQDSRKEKNNYIIEKADAGDAKDGDLVRINARPAKGYGPRRANIVEIIGRLDDPRAACIDRDAHARRAG